MASSFIKESQRPRVAPLASGLRDALPIVLAYLPVAVTYGILAAGAGMPAWLVILASLVIYAGASQFMLVSLYVVGVAPFPLALTLLLVNLRHLLYGTTIGRAFARWNESNKWIAAFGLTDEVFAVTSSRVTRASPAPAYQFALSFACYGSWVMGSILGALVGVAVPATLAHVLTFALPALFLSLLLGQARGAPQLAAAAFGAAAAVIATVAGSSGVGIVAGATIGATAGMLLSRRTSRDV